MMRYPAQDLEPAERDPKKLRRTALVLVLLMAVGGLMVLAAYNRNAKRQAEDERPAIITRLNQNFKLWRQDESEAGLLDLAGDVFVVAPVAFAEPEGWKTTRQVLEDLKARYADRDDFHIVCLTVDPENEPPAELAGYARELGAELPFWWLAGSRQESTHKFLKNQLKGGTVPIRKDGKWFYDSALVLVDRDRHVRQPTIRARKPGGKELNYRNAVPFDFEQAAAWDAEGRSEGLEKSNVLTLKDLLFKSIDELLATPAREDSSS